MNETPRERVPDTRLEALLDRVAAPAPSAALMDRLTGPGALARLTAPPRVERSLGRRAARPPWLGYAAAAMLGVVVGAGVLGLWTRPSTVADNAVLAAGEAVPAFVGGAGFARVDASTDLTAGIPTTLALYYPATTLDDGLDDVPLD